MEAKAATASQMAGQPAMATGAQSRGKASLSISKAIIPMAAELSRPMTDSILR